MIFILKIILFTIYTHQLLFSIYYWQIKEYRLDRFIDSLNNKYDLFRYIKNQYNLFSWFRPKITFRTLISFIFSLLIVF